MRRKFRRYVLKQLKKLKLLSFIFCFFSFNIFFGANAFAEEVNTGGVKVQISPNIQKMELDPGAVYKNNFTITNNGSTPFSYKLVVSPYSVEDTTYAPIYSVENAYTQITNWISFDDKEFEGVVEPAISKVINYTVTVPDDVPSGGQYAVIFVQSKEASETGESIQTIASPGLVLVARVNGDTRETGEIKDLNIPTFLLNPPVSASATFVNDGNVDVEAKMTLKIENYFSGEVIYDGTKEPLEKTLFPGTTRDLSISWSNVPRLGILKVTLSAEYPGDAAVKTRTVFICPIWFIALIVLFIIVIIIRATAGRRENRRTRANSRENDIHSSGKFNL